MAVEPIHDDDPRLSHPKCGRWMPLAEEPCYRWPGHRDFCRSRFAVEYGRELRARKYAARKVRQGAA